MGDFKKYCHSNDIGLVVFRPSDGTKRRLGVVERFNRTLKGYMYLDWERASRQGQRKLTVPELLIKVLKEYNWVHKHTGITKFGRWSQGYGKGDAMPRGTKWTPLTMLLEGMEEAFQQHQEEKREETEDYYHDTIQRMTLPRSQRPKVRYYKKLDSTRYGVFGDKFQNRGGGNMSKAVDIMPRHRYTNHGGKTNHATAQGDSFALSDTMGGRHIRVLPYDVQFA